MNCVLRGTYNLIPSAKYRQCQQLPKQCSLPPLSWLTPTVHPQGSPYLLSCFQLLCHVWLLALLAFVGMCDFCLENSSMELWHCPGHGTDSICKDPVLSGLSFWWRLLGQLHWLWMRTQFCPRSGSREWGTDPKDPKGALGWPSLVSPLSPLQGSRDWTPS